MSACLTSSSEARQNHLVGRLPGCFSATASWTHPHRKSREGMGRVSRQCSGGWMIVWWEAYRVCVCTSMRRASLSSAVAPKCRLLNELYSCTMSPASSRSFSS
jgi:hypothetical protein